MVSFDLVLVLLDVVMAIEGFNIEGFHHHLESKTCKQLVSDNQFKLEMVVGKQWVIYYIWNIEPRAFSTKCQEVRYKNATPSIVNRIWNDMYEYLETQPLWSTATLVMNLTPLHEMLLFPDHHVPGRYVGVGNFMRSGVQAPSEKKTVPLFKVQFLLLEHGAWLVVSDCNIGFTTLSARLDLKPVVRRQDILNVASSLELGPGHLTCISKIVEMNKTARQPFNWPGNS